MRTEIDGLRTAEIRGREEISDLRATIDLGSTREREMAG